MTSQYYADESGFGEHDGPKEQVKKEKRGEGKRKERRIISKGIEKIEKEERQERSKKKNLGIEEEKNWRS